MNVYLDNNIYLKTEASVHKYIASLVDDYINCNA
jgi:hypothetical protein